MSRKAIQVVGVLLLVVIVITVVLIWRNRTVSPGPGPGPGPATIGACSSRPAATTTGASGELTPQRVSVLGDGAVLQNAVVDKLEVRGSGVQVHNVVVRRGLRITGDGALIDRVSTTGIVISSASDVTVQFSNVGMGTEDAIHISSDRGRMVRNILLQHNYIHSPNVPPTAHYDGTQIRGADGVQISCSVYDPGPYKRQLNAAVYLEDANGGTRNVQVVHNWLNGYAWSVMVDAENVMVADNTIGGDVKWGSCYLGRRTDPSSVRDQDNVRGGIPDGMCADAARRRQTS